MGIYALAIIIGFLVSNIRQSDSFEKQALVAVQQVPAFELDVELPKSPFGDWFKQLVGPKAGVIWQLAECVPVGSPTRTGQDLQACAEVNALLPNGSKVIVAITVGTFKEGLKGRPAFFGALIDHNEQVNQIRRLHELPVVLHSPEKLSKRPPEVLAVEPALKLIPQTTSFSPLSLDINPAEGNRIEASVPPPPKPKSSRLQNVNENVLLGNAITKVMPIYPASARSMNAYGNVEVQVTVSEDGFVIDAKAVSGHPALRSAAVEAARKWIFKPSTLGGAPVKVQSILTFVFASRAQ